MDDEQVSNERTSSTTWAWRRVRMSTPPQAKSDRERSEAPQGSLLAWPRGKPCTVVLKYRGGPECWVEVRARGRIWRRPGTTALYDIVREVWGWDVR